MKVWMTMSAGLLWLAQAGTAPAAAQAPAEVLAAYKAAAGGARWDGVTSLASEGTLKTAGLEGTLTQHEVLADGRSVGRYVLGTLKGASGYDGRQAWEQDPGGEIAVMDAPTAAARAQTDAWMTQRAFWFPARHAATYQGTHRADDAGTDCIVVDATPANGAPIQLWFDAATHLLVRSDSHDGKDELVTRYSDWREVDGLRLPFHVVTDRNGDARARVDIQFASIRTNATFDAAEFQMPQLDRANARILDPSGRTTIAFRLVNNHIYADAEMDGQPLHMLVDTGGFNALTPAAAKRVGAQQEGQLAAQGVGSERPDVSIAHPKRLRFGAAQIDAPTFYVIDFAVLPDVEGEPVDGLLGFEVFRRFGLDVDYAANRLTLSEPAKFEIPPGAQGLDFTYSDRTPIVHGRIDGIPARFTLDTGSRTTATLHAPFARKHDFAKTYGATTDAVVGWGVGGPALGRPARFRTLELAGVELKDVAGEIFLGAKGTFASDDADVNIGGGIFRRFRVAFDYEHRKVYFAPNSTVHEPFAFDRSGLWLLTDAGTLRATDVAAGSAAAQAGLQAEDRILAIDGEPVGKRSLSDWRRELATRAAGTKVKVQYRRGTTTAETILTLADRVAVAR